MSHRLLRHSLCFATLLASVHGLAQTPPADALLLLRAANADRARFHLSPLRWSPPLAAAAGRHASVVLHHQTLEHQYPGEPDPLSRAASAGASLAAEGENLLRGTATTAAAVEESWLNSPEHRANLLNPAFDLAGISVLHLGNGTILAVEELGRSAEPFAAGTTEDRLIHQLQLLHVSAVQITSAARAICVRDDPSATATPPATVVQWDGPDAFEIPPSVRALLNQHTFHSAELAACPGAGAPSGFAVTRVVVLLR